MKIAVIGSGIAGLSAALLLDKDHDVYLIEKDSRLGGHANTVTIEKEDGTIAVDTGFIVYNERNYPLFTKLLNHLGVSSRPTEMSFSVSDKLLGFEFRPTGFRTLFPAFANLANFPLLHDARAGVNHPNAIRLCFWKTGTEREPFFLRLSDFLKAPVPCPREWP